MSAGVLSVEWPFGFLTVRTEGDSLKCIDFDKAAQPAQSTPYAEEVARQLRAYLSKELTEFDLNLNANGTEFFHRVWDELVKVPYGQTTTYGALATKLGLTKGSSRAVGAANAKNPIPIVVPCHRVVGTNGLTGFAGGLDAKAWLLAHEGQILF